MSADETAGAIFGLFIILIYLALIVFMIVCYWKIFSKAGFSGALSLLLLVPIANIFAIGYLAFADWPALKDRIGSDVFN